jgi:hypothetical protein
MTTRCSACKGRYQEASGQRLSARTVLCAACARAWRSWLETQLGLRTGGFRFYEHAARSIRP